MDVKLDADRLEVALDDRFASDASWIAGCTCRVLELQALPAPGAHAIWAFHPAVVREQLIGERRIKLRTVRIQLVARMQRRGMVGAQRRGEPLTSHLDQGLV